MNILETIVEHKYEEVAKRKRDVKRSALAEMQYFERMTLPFRDALNCKEPFAIIAEIKRSSPSAGALNHHINPPKFAEEYEKNGAAAISILTDERFFHGTLQDVLAVREVVQLPILRKEFIIDEYQIVEAKAHGADAILLIASILERSHLKELFIAAKESHLECLVELYDEAEIDKLDFDIMKLVGINNRDLKTFEVDLGRTLQMAYRIPKDITLVSESGIHSSYDLKKLKTAGIQAALVGEHLMNAESPGTALRALLDGVQSNLL